MEDPEAAEQIARAMAIVADYRRRQSGGDTETPDELIGGFPELRDQLAALLGVLAEDPLPGRTNGPADGNDVPPGDRLGRFRLVAPLGRGGMGQVHLAVDERLGRQVAVKQIHPERLLDHTARARFAREARALSGLDHPGLCKVFEAGEEQGCPYLVMQYVEGETIAAKLAAERERSRSARMGSSHRSGPASWMAAAQTIEIVARAIHHAHEHGFVHRDIKPGNIMIDRTGAPIVLDFGLVRAESDLDATLTLSDQQLGTPAYMAPEQIVPAGRRPDRRTDVYALGVTLYEMLTHERPFDAPTRHELFHGVLNGTPIGIRMHSRLVPRDLAIVVATAMARDPDRRYASALDLADDLRRVRSREPIRARRPTPIVRTWRWSRRNRLATTLIAVLGALVFVSALLVSMQRDAQARERKSDALLLGKIREVSDLWSRGMVAEAAGGAAGVTVIGASYDIAREWNELSARVERDRWTADRIREIRTKGQLLPKWTTQRVAREYSAVFSGLGIENAALLSPAELDTIRASPIRNLLVDALYDSALSRIAGAESEAARIPAMDLLGTIRQLDPSSAGKRFLAVMASPGLDARIAFARSPDATKLPTPAVLFLARALTLAGARNEALQLSDSVRLYRTRDPALHLWHARFLRRWPNEDDASTTEVERSIEALHAAIEAMPESSIAWYDLGVSLWHLPRIDDAEHCIRRSIELDDQEPSFHLGLGQLLLTAKRFDAAVGAYRALIAVAPSDFEDLAIAWDELGKAIGQSSKPDYREALAWIVRALVASPGNPTFQRDHLATTELLARSLRELGDWPEEAELWQAVSDNPMFAQLEFGCRLEAAGAAAWTAATSKLSAEERRAWLDRAVGWLNDDLTDRGELDGTDAKTRRARGRRLDSWLMGAAAQVPDVESSTALEEAVDLRRWRDALERARELRERLLH